MGLRSIERVTDIHHTTVMGWVKEGGLKLPDVPETDEKPEIADLDELQTFVGNKRHKIWLWTEVNHWRPGIVAWTIGDRSSTTGVAGFSSLLVFLAKNIIYLPDKFPECRLLAKKLFIVSIKLTYWTLGNHAKC